MRKLSPAFITASVALALASGAALGQARITTSQGVVSATGTTSSTTSGSATGSTGAARAPTGGCVGTGGSTCSTATTSAGSTGDASVGSTGPTESPRDNARADAAVAPAPPSSAQLRQGSPATPTLQAGQTPGDPNAPFRVTPNDPNAMRTAAALGRSLGQTSAGTASAASSTGVGTGDSLGLTTPPDTNIAVPGAVVVPGGTITGFGFTGGADAGSGVNANGERVGGGADFRAGAAVASNQATPTPIFDMAAARGAAREQARRARGDEPRIIGIAPRTDRDLTHQMPDDPIIRY